MVFVVRQGSAAVVRTDSDMRKDTEDLLWLQTRLRATVSRGGRAFPIFFSARSQLSCSWQASINPPAAPPAIPRPNRQRRAWPPPDIISAIRYVPILKLLRRYTAITVHSLLLAASRCTRCTAPPSLAFRSQPTAPKQPPAAFHLSLPRSAPSVKRRLSVLLGSPLSPPVGERSTGVGDTVAGTTARDADRAICMALPTRRTGSRMLCSIGALSACNP